MERIAELLWNVFPKKEENSKNMGMHSIKSRKASKVWNLFPKNVEKAKNMEFIP